MYQINSNTYAIEENDKIAFVRDGGGDLDIFIGEEEALRDPETGPRVIEKGERVEIFIAPKVPFYIL